MRGDAQTLCSLEPRKVDGSQALLGLFDLEQVRLSGLDDRQLNPPLVLRVDLNNRSLTPVLSHVGSNQEAHRVVWIQLRKCPVVKEKLDFSSVFLNEHQRLMEGEISIGFCTYSVFSFSRLISKRVQAHIRAHPYFRTNRTKI